MLEREAAEDERHLDEVGAGLIGRRQGFDLSLEEVEGAHAEGDEEPVLRPEQAVDGARRRAGSTRHLAQSEGVEAILGNRALGGVEQRRRGLVVVLPGPSHS